MKSEGSDIRKREQTRALWTPGDAYGHLRIQKEKLMAQTKGPHCESLRGTQTLKR